MPFHTVCMATSALLVPKVKQGFQVCSEGQSENCQAWVDTQRADHGEDEKRAVCEARGRQDILVQSLIYSLAHALCSFSD